jgi:hypothetical protein
MSLANSLCLLKLENSSIEFEQKVFVCLVDNIVVGNISNTRIISGGMEVFMPTWEGLEKILTTPNHKFIKNDKCILVGTIWNGQEFTAPIEPVSEYESNIPKDIICKKVQNSYIYYDNNMWIAVKDYTMYVIQLLEDYLNINSTLCVNIFVNINTNNSIEISNANKTIKIGINFEQTIVSDELVAFGVEPQGKIEFNNKKYTVRMETFNVLNQMDIVIDYSKPNIRNIEISGLYNDYLKKIKYISPCVYKSVNNSLYEKKTNIITLFSDMIQSPRRENIITELNKLDNYINRYDCYNTELLDLLIDTKILINIHQSDYENTFEEIRVLPALMNKVLVISEISPLNEIVPYNPLIIWATYDNIIEKTKEVLQNYEEYFNKIFTNENINLLNNLNNMNKMNIFQMLQ